MATVTLLNLAAGFATEPSGRSRTIGAQLEPGSRRLELHPLSDELHSLGENAGADSESALDNAGLAPHVNAAFPEAERDGIRERIGHVNADQKARGRYLGGSIPLGYRLGDDGGKRRSAKWSRCGRRGRP